jgi:hypothetical protein
VAKANKYNDDYQETVVRALRYCWDKGIYAFPVVVDGNRGKRNPPVKIQMNIGNTKKIGEVLYDQKSSDIYEKIDELYVHYFNKRNE